MSSTGAPFGIGSAEYCAWPSVELGDVVARHALQEGERAGTLQLELAHVRDVEEPGRLPHREVLGDHAAVLDRHLPAGEGHHLRAQGAVSGMERGSLEIGRHR